MFENLNVCRRGGFGSFRGGFCTERDGITRLVLDDARLSLGSFDAIVDQMESITEVSLVGLEFSGTSPANLDTLLGIDTLSQVTVDPVLFEQYADEFSAFAAIDGHTVTVVPEPAARWLLLIAIVGLIVLNRHSGLLNNCPVTGPDASGIDPGLAAASATPTSPLADQSQGIQGTLSVPTNESASTEFRVASIPEPSTLLLGAICSIGLLVRRRW